MPEHNSTPGEAIQAELDRRGWTHDTLARMVGRHRPEISMVIAGKRSLTAELAVPIAKVLGNSAEWWLSLEASRQLRLIPDDPTDVSKRVRMFELAPIADMEKRQWIRPTQSDAQLESELCKFFEISSLNDEPTISVATRRSEPHEALSPAQRAWCFRAKHLARSVMAAPFDPAKMDAASADLRKLAASSERVKVVTKTLADFGIRFVLIEPLPGSRIDGVTLWLDERSPVIAMSIRYDRIDWFWFTLAHELSHVRHGDASVDADLVGKGAVPTAAKPAEERRADLEAANLLIPEQEMESFMLRAGPMYSKVRIIQFAHRVKIHPGIVVGQLQHSGELGWEANREMLAKVRDSAKSTALTDGWGTTVGPIA